MNTIASPVIVGVDGTAENRGALRFAVEESRRSGGRLTLVHVAPDYVPLSPIVPLVASDMSETGAAVLARAADDVRDIDPDIQVRTLLHHGARAPVLVRVAEQARILVVGRDDRPFAYRLVDGDTATRTASRASVPVVEVPPRWHEDGAVRGGSPTVLVGVKSPSRAAELLGHAFAAAQERDARLVVLHAWRLPSAYDDIIEGRVAQERVEREGVAGVEQLLHQWLVAYPTVEVTVRIVHERPAQALVAASSAADLLVIVRRGHGVPPATHLGGTARAVLRHADCPVMVVPPQQVPDVPALVLEEHGQALK